MSSAKRSAGTFVARGALCNEAAPSLLPARGYPLASTQSALLSELWIWSFAITRDTVLGDRVLDALLGRLCASSVGHLNVITGFSALSSYYPLIISAILGVNSPPTASDMKQVREPDKLFHLSHW